MFEKLPPTLVPSNDMLRAIGTVAVRWGFIEWLADGEIKYLRGFEVNKDTGFGFNLSFEKRCRYWRKFARRIFPPVLIKEVEQISAQATGIKKKRDGIVHGTYSGTSSGISENVFQSVSRFAEHVSTEETSVGTIDAIAHQIGLIGTDIGWHATQVAFWRAGQKPQWQPQPPQ